MRRLIKYILITIALLPIITVASCYGPASPFDTTYQDDSEIRQEYEEGKTENATLDAAMKADPCLEDIIYGVPEEYRRCGGNSRRPVAEIDALDEIDINYPASISPCLNGCRSYVEGCDIKGNISFVTGEKIYLVPGQGFYEETKIDPDYGERWFCTEQEAKANGWRKAYE